MEHRQTSDDAASGQDLHCLLTVFSIKICRKKEIKILPNTLKIGNGIVLQIRVGKSTWLKWDYWHNTAFE